MTRAFAFALALAAATATPAHADPPPPDVRLLGGVDLLLTTDPTPGATLGNAELGLTLRADARHLAHDRLDLKLDFRGREGIVGDSNVNQLWEVSATWHAHPRVDVKLGRFPTPGGFWLVADGALVRVRYASWISQSLFGGLRSFTTGRRDTWMSEQPLALPLAGTQLVLDHRIVIASLGFTWARDGIDQHLGEDDLTHKNLIERNVQDEYFLDGQIGVMPHDTLYLGAGASFGTRYDVRFDAASPYGPTTLAVATLGAFDAWGVAEWRARKNLRLTYTFNFERVRLFQSELLARKADGSPVQAADGSYEDHVLHLAWRAWRALRVDVSYRLRYRANTDLEHHPELSVRADELWRGLGAFGAVAADVNSLTGKVHDRVLWSAGLSFARPWLDVRAGVQYTQGVGSGLTFSQRTPTSPANEASQLFPYVLESNEIAFVRAFGQFWRMYAGADVEANLNFGQVRMLLQIGAAL
jgi:hypothetical protein